MRAEPLGLKIADVRHLELDQGSFELVYWHDALARILNCATEHADRWQQDQQNHNSCEEHTPDADRRRARRRPHRPASRAGRQRRRRPATQLLELTNRMIMDGLIRCGKCSRTFNLR